MLCFRSLLLTRDNSAISPYLNDPTVRDNPTDALSNLLSMTRREMGINSTCAGMRPTAGSSDKRSSPIPQEQLLL